MFKFSSFNIIALISVHGIYLFYIGGLKGNCFLSSFVIKIYIYISSRIYENRTIRHQEPTQLKLT